MSTEEDSTQGIVSITNKGEAQEKPSKGECQCPEQRDRAVINLPSDLVNLHQLVSCIAMLKDPEKGVCAQAKLAADETFTSAY